ncbi:MAG: sigma 54-interacting transcriptional regulator [Candidatus Moduliflexus flocculans]|nr:sigma 54-interacting transcriptional regulator [Candidatus Moduliflexus flocculans]
MTTGHSTASVLIIDDDKIICDWITNVVTQLGHRAVSAHLLRDGLKRLQSEPFDVVFVDVHLPDGDGLEILPKIKAARSSPETIVITALGHPDEAELAIRGGAWDYLEKPASFDAIKCPIIRALEYRSERKPGNGAVLKRNGIIGDSAKIVSCLELVGQAADSDVNVLITGETGTGKELFAKVVHANSRRAKKSFVVVDCTALPETLVESVLFGHARGAFTGAETSEVGLVKQADGGTLFLDEIGEMPLSIQKKFLRVVQEHRFRPVGGRREISSDFRLMARRPTGIWKPWSRRDDSGKTSSSGSGPSSSIPPAEGDHRRHPQADDLLYQGPVRAVRDRRQRGLARVLADHVVTIHGPATCGS